MSFALPGLRQFFSLRAGENERTSMSTHQLVTRVLQGDVAAVGEIYSLHHAHVRSFARRLLGDDTAAEDLTHDVFVALPDALSRFRGDASLQTLLFSIAVNQVRSHIRTAVRRRRALEALGHHPIEPLRDPETSMGQRQLAHQMSLALDTLPLDQRVAFVLCELEDRSAAEVAQIVQAPEATVRTRVFHARKKLREHFAALDPQGSPT